MNEKLTVQWVALNFVGTPTVQRIERASGVSEVEVDGAVLRCLASGSFQLFLEPLRGYDVMSLKSTSPKGEGERADS